LKKMGLGKTIQILALLLLNPPGNQNPALIACPTSLITNWCREIEKFAPSFTYLVHRGSNRTGYYKNLMRSDIVITTYDTLVNDISAITGVEWSYLICDEAQAVKNPNSRRREKLATVPRTFTIPVTGTPIETSLMDLWSLADLAIPGLLGTKHYFGSLYPDSEDGARELSIVTDPIILKRQVKDVAGDLPERTNINLPISMSDIEAVEYERIRKEVLDEYGPAGPLVAVGQLSLFTAHPWLRIRDTDDDNWEDNIELHENDAFTLITPKVEACLNILAEAFMRNKKVLIFASYNYCGHLLKRAGERLSLPNAYWNAINGSTPQDERQSIVDEYTEHLGPAALVLNPRAAGAGLNITAATIVVHYTQNWNPALEMQASARAHRRGQEMPVTVYRLFYENTVEETMIARCEWRANIADIAVAISNRENQDREAALTSSPLQSK
jgi:SNF2 family DNA or RNA helicase